MEKVMNREDHRTKSCFATLCALMRASFSLHNSSAHQSHPRGAFLLHKI